MDGGDTTERVTLKEVKASGPLTCKGSFQSHEPNTF